MDQCADSPQGDGSIPRWLRLQRQFSETQSRREPIHTASDPLNADVPRIRCDSNASISLKLASRLKSNRPHHINRERHQRCDHDRPHGLAQAARQCTNHGGASHQRLPVTDGCRIVCRRHRNSCPRSLNESTRVTLNAIGACLVPRLVCLQVRLDGPATAGQMSLSWRSTGK